MKGRVQAKNGHWYVVIERGKGQTPVWRKTGLTEKNNKRRAEGMIERIVADYEVSINAAANEPNPDPTVESSQNQRQKSRNTQRTKGVQLQNTPMSSESPPFSDIVRNYLSVAKIGVKENTYEKYRIAAETHIIPYFDALASRIGEIDTSDLQDYIACKVKILEKSTLKTHKTVLNQTFKYAIRPLGLIKENPMVDVVLGKVSNTVVNYYTPDLMDALLKNIANEGPEIKIPVLLASYYGLRRQEVLGLQWSAVNFKDKTIEIRRTATKAGKKTIYADTVKSKSSHRTMPLFPEVEAILNRLYERQRRMQTVLKKGYDKNTEICKWDDGHLVRPDYVTSKFPKLLEKYGMPPLTFHELRHSTASLLLSQGYSLQEIQLWLGHADIKSTMIYAHLQCDKSKQKMAKTIGGCLHVPDMGL